MYSGLEISSHCNLRKEMQVDETLFYIWMFLGDTKTDRLQPFMKSATRKRC